MNHFRRFGVKGKYTSKKETNGDHHWLLLFNKIGKLSRTSIPERLELGSQLTPGMENAALHRTHRDG